MEQGNCCVGKSQRRKTLGNDWEETCDWSEIKLTRWEMNRLEIKISTNIIYLHFIDYVSWNNKTVLLLLIAFSLPQTGILQNRQFRTNEVIFNHNSDRGMYCEQLVYKFSLYLFIISK